MISEIKNFEKWAKENEFIVDWKGVSFETTRKTLEAWAMWRSISQCLRGIEL